MAKQRKINYELLDQYTAQKSEELEAQRKALIDSLDLPEGWEIEDIIDHPYALDDFPVGKMNGLQFKEDKVYLIRVKNAKGNIEALIIKQEELEKEQSEKIKVVERIKSDGELEATDDYTSSLKDTKGFKLDKKQHYLDHEKGESKAVTREEKAQKDRTEVQKIAIAVGVQESDIMQVITIQDRAALAVAGKSKEVYAIRLNSGRQGKDWEIYSKNSQGEYDKEAGEEVSDRMQLVADELSYGNVSSGHTEYTIRNTDAYLDSSTLDRRSHELMVRDRFDFDEKTGHIRQESNAQVSICHTAKSLEELRRMDRIEHSHSSNNMANNMGDYVEAQKLKEELVQVKEEIKELEENVPKRTPAEEAQLDDLYNEAERLLLEIEHEERDAGENYGVAATGNTIEEEDYVPGPSDRRHY